MTEVKRPLSLQLGTRPAAQLSSAPKSATTTPVAIRPQTMSMTSATNKRAAIEPRRQQQQQQSKQLTTSASASSLASFASSTASSSTSSSSSTSFTPCPPSPQAAGCFASQPDSPSLILPYLYVGDQAQTQIDTISNLNISYVLSLQSLPKFLDSDIQVEGSYENGCSTAQATSDFTTDASNGNAIAGQAAALATDARDIPSTSTSVNRSYNSPIVKRVNKNGHLEQISMDNVDFAQNVTTGIGAHGDRCGEDAARGDDGESSSILVDSDEQISNQTMAASELLPSMNGSKDYLVKFRSCVNRLIKGKCINISDTFEQYVEKFFDETHNFIEEARRNKCNILVHCKAGISRSPTIAIAYLMKWKRLHLQDAYDFVKRCRPQISPNLNFMGQLMNYERRLLQRGLHKPLLPSPIASCLPSYPCNREQQHQHQQGPATSQQNQQS